MDRAAPTACNRPPPGWHCTRPAYHLGPCAAYRVYDWSGIWPGDIILTQDESWVSRTIRYFESKRDHEDVYASHAMIVAHDGKCINATVPRVNKLPITAFPQYRAYRIKEPIIRYAVASAAEIFLGDYYGISHLILHALGLGRWATYRGTPICSMVAGEALAVGFNMSEFVMDGRVVRCDLAEPADIEDWCVAHPELIEPVE